MLRSFEDASQREIEEDQNEGKTFTVPDPDASGAAPPSQADYAAAMEDKARELAAIGLRDGSGEDDPMEVRNIALADD